MTPIADMVEMMLAKDTPADVIVLAIRTAEASHVTKCDAYSSNPSAIRMRRKRNNDKQNQPSAKANDVAENSVTSDVTCDVTCDGNAVVLTSFSESVVKERGLQEVRKNLLPEFVEGQKKVSRGTRMVAGAILSDENFKFAAEQGLRLIEIETAWAEFVDYWISVPGQRGTKLNWDATWRNRVRELCGRRTRNGQIAAGDRARAFADKIREVERSKGIG